MEGCQCVCVILKRVPTRAGHLRFLLKTTFKKKDDRLRKKKPQVPRARDYTNFSGPSMTATRPSTTAIVLLQFRNIFDSFELCSVSRNFFCYCFFLLLFRGSKRCSCRLSAVCIFSKIRQLDNSISCAFCLHYKQKKNPPVPHDAAAAEVYQSADEVRYFGCFYFLFAFSFTFRFLLCHMARPINPFHSDCKAVFFPHFLQISVTFLIFKT